MAEFVNPKYADKEKTTFKKPTRLECMMQDYPKILDSAGSKVGFTMFPSWLCYSPCKNNALDAAASIAAGVPAGAAAVAEADQYFYPAELLRRLGATIPAAPVVAYKGIAISLGPKIVFSPSFALFPCEVKQRFPFPTKLSLNSSSSLVVEGDVQFESLHLDGALRLTATPGSKLIVRGGHMTIFNAGYAVRPEGGGGGGSVVVDEVTSMRGYSLHKVAEELATADCGHEVVFTGKNVTAAVVYDQEPETSCTDSDTCGGCVLRAFFRFLNLDERS